MFFRLLKLYGATIEISTANITTEEGCEDLIKVALSLGPVGGIFNLAVSLHDGIFENVDLKMFNESLAPKALATKNLDKMSRKLCPVLSHFVVFSSMSCGRGNAGQSIYGMANSVMERIIEDRHKLGLPAKAIQWGAIGDVGLLAEFQLSNMGKDISGTLPQSISSCLEVLDRLLVSADPIVSSMVVADKHTGDGAKRNIIDTILKIMGVRDKKSISMDSTLTQLGIDSLMGVEIQQVLERDYDIAFTSQELRSLTLSQLEKRAMSKNSSGNSNSSEELVPDEISWMRMLMEGVVDMETMELFSTETIVEANDVPLTEDTKILIIPGFYGVAADIYRNFGKELNHPTFVLQLLETSTCTEIEDIVEVITPSVLQLFNDVGNFILIGHSFGCNITLKLASILENGGKTGHIIQLDGSPQYNNRFAHKMSPERNDDGIREAISMIVFDFFTPHVDPDVVKRAFLSHNKWEEKVDAMLLESVDRIPYSYEFIKLNIFTAVSNRFKIVLHTKEDSFSTLKHTKMSLIKAGTTSVKGLHKDYGLSRYCSNQLRIRVLEGDHVTLINNLELPKLIKELTFVM